MSEDYGSIWLVAPAEEDLGRDMEILIFKAGKNHETNKHLHTLFLFYKKPTTWRVGSTFLRKPRFEAQKFLNFVQISAFTFLTFSYFQP